MGPPKSSGKRPSSSDAGSVQSSPTTPASAPGTPLPDQAPAKRAKVKKATEQTVLTPLQKAKDMCTKLLKKKSDASNLGLTLQSVAYADALSAEMTQFAKKFEFLGNKSFFPNLVTHMEHQWLAHCMVFNLHCWEMYMISLCNEFPRELYLKIQAMMNDQKNEEHYMHEPLGVHFSIHASLFVRCKFHS